MFRHWQLGMQSKREAYASLGANLASSPRADVSAAFAFFCVMMKKVKGSINYWRRGNYERGERGEPGRGCSV
jgi:hypothetical protein